MTNAVGTSNTVTANLLAMLPGLAVASNYVRAVRHPDGVIINGTGASETGYITAAAAGTGDLLALYGTGFGPTAPAGHEDRWINTIPGKGWFVYFRI